ncbi:phasin family protein [Azospirillum picis]|uniref:Phasin family protein n=1 Tax=Azospirillum picis TaxID=488438 RepID=A0ABU0MF61_9PROT|nr:TIGR01841 family phasin [Azospirillum picis]MBP2298240.1 phasin family protein [Azospirillum picis]MDQ0532078.1 phasin family protein [Azospirillum picis]
MNQFNPKSIDSVTTQAKEQYEGLVKAGQEQTLKQFEQTATAAKEQFEKATAQMLKSYEDLQAAGKANAEALIASSTIAAKGAEDLGREVVAYGQSALDKSIAAGRALLSAKTLQEVIELQNDFLKSSFDSMLAETSRLQELTTKVTNEALAPLNARVTATVETLSKPVAKPVANPLAA